MTIYDRQALQDRRGAEQPLRGRDDPFYIVTRLAEECGEVASQVNHFERKGVKTLKLGPPDRAAFAKELQDVMRAVVQLAIHYELEAELEASVDRSYREIVIKGIVDPLPEELEGRND